MTEKQRSQKHVVRQLYQSQIRCASYQTLLTVRNYHYSQTIAMLVSLADEKEMHGSEGGAPAE